jgi:hypothetical protein
MRSPGPQTICERISYAKHDGSFLEQKLDEHARPLEARESTAPWRQGGPHLIDRQWGTLSVERGRGPELALSCRPASLAYWSLAGGKADPKQAGYL